MAAAVFFCGKGLRYEIGILGNFFFTLFEPLSSSCKKVFPNRPSGGGGVFHFLVWSDRLILFSGSYIAFRNGCLGKLFSPKEKKQEAETIAKQSGSFFFKGGCTPQLLGPTEEFNIWLRNFSWGVWVSDFMGTSRPEGGVRLLLKEKSMG